MYQEIWIKNNKMHSNLTLVIDFYTHSKPKASIAWMNINSLPFALFQKYILREHVCIFYCQV